MKQNYFSNTVLIGSIFVCGFLLIYTFSRDSLVLYQIFFVVLLVALVISLKTPPDFKINVSLALISIGFTLVAVEVFLKVIENTDDMFEAHVAAAAREETQFDFRTPLQVVEDLRKEGVYAYPSVNIKGLEISGETVNPLAGVANKTTVFCNESGDYSIYESDEHGFRNPKGIWGKVTIDVVSVGDSFTHGACVPPGKTSTDLVREVFSNTLNLGISSSGPLDELARIKEFAVDLRPRIVLWFYYEGNDLDNLISKGIGTPKPDPLVSYLQGGYRQDLVAKQQLIDAALIKEINQQIVDGPETVLSDNSGNIIQRIALPQLRARISSLTQSCNYYLQDSTFDNLQLVLQQAKDHVDSWDGELYFVYLPMWARYGSPRSACVLGPDDESHRKVVESAETVGLTVLDMAEAFANHPDPESLYPFRMHGHFTEEGQRLVAEAVLELID